MTVRVQLLGRPGIMPAGGAAERQPRGHKSWAVLARIALAERPLTRRELATELFEDAQDPLGALRWRLADLRRCLHGPGLLRGERLALQRDAALRLDVWALEDGTLEDDELGGELLEGVTVSDSPRFEAWLLLARSRTAARSREELRGRAMRALATGHTEDAARIAERAARLDPLDQPAQELLLRALVADGRAGLALAQLAVCEGMFAREGLPVSATLRAAAHGQGNHQPRGVGAAVTAESLLRAGTAALAAGAADGGVETLRRASEDADRSADPALQARVLHALGSALVHAVRGCDGEGALALNRALVHARQTGRSELTAEVLRELAFVDVQAGRHASAARSLREARQLAEHAGDPGVLAGVLAIDGMNEADRGRHRDAAATLRHSAQLAAESGRERQHAWSLGVLARSELLHGDPVRARATADASVEAAGRERWNAFLPWPQTVRAECLAAVGDWSAARRDAEQAFALGCELGDPCWEGMAARELGLLAAHSGDLDAAWDWLRDARQRCDRVTDRYVWVSAYIGLAQLQLAARVDQELVAPLARRLRDDAARADLPEFMAWALVHLAECGQDGCASLARTAARGVDNPRLLARVDRLKQGAGPASAS